MVLLLVLLLLLVVLLLFFFFFWPFLFSCISCPVFGVAPQLAVRPALSSARGLRGAESRKLLQEAAAVEERWLQSQPPKKQVEAVSGTTWSYSV